MEKKTPEEVLRSVSMDFKNKGITHRIAAETIGFGSKQTVANILSSKRYLSSIQALKFSKAFGYNQNYLMTGEGELISKEESERRENLRRDRLLTGVVDIILKEDALQVLYWFKTVLSHQNNLEGLAICTEVYKYLNVSQIVRMELMDYKGENYSLDFAIRSQEIKSKIAENIDRIVDGIINS